MEILSKNEFLAKEDYIESIRKGKLFIYPTDTVYGLGCNALLASAVKKLREIKNRDARPFSVIVPSKEWIIQNCEMNDFAKRWFNKLPGKYTLLMKLKDKDIVKNANNSLEILGVRIPDHWFSKIIAEAGVPFITTSVNLAGGVPMTSLKDVNDTIKNNIDYIIYEGEKKGKPSAIVNTITQEILKR